MMLRGRARLYAKNGGSVPFWGSLLEIAAEILLEDEADGAAKARHATFAGGVETGDRAAGEDLVLDFGLNHGSEAVPGAGEIADHDDALGSKAGDDHAHAPPEVMGHGFEGLDGADIAVVGAAEKIGKSQAIGSGAGFEVIAESGSIGGVDLPTTAAATAANGALGIERHVAEFAGHAVRAAHQLAIQQDSGADAFRDGDDDEVAAGLHVFEPNGGEHAGVSGVFEFHLDAGSLHDGSAQIEIAPPEIGGEDQTVGALVEAAGEADADAFELLAAAGISDALNGLQEFVDGGLGIGRGRDDFAGGELAVGVGEGDGGLLGADIDADDDAVVIEPEEGGTASAGQAAGGAFDDPGLVDQLFDDQRNGAAL